MIDNIEGGHVGVTKDVEEVFTGEKEEIAEEMEQQEPDVVEEQPIDNHIVSPQTKIKEFDYENSDTKGIIFPSGQYRSYKEFMEQILSYERRMEEAENNEYVDAPKPISQKSAEAISLATAGISKVTQLNMFTSQFKQATNDCYVGDKPLTVRSLNVKGGKEATSGRKALLKMASKLGLSNVIQIPLIHSGFWITLRPLSLSDIVALETEFTKTEIELGRRTNGIVYSNEDVIYKKIVADFIITHLESSSFRYDDEDLIDYIKPQDLDIILLGISSALYPNGYKMIRTCKNTLKLEKTDKEEKPVCGYTFEATVDPAKMLFVNYHLLSDKQKEQLTKTAPSSVVKDEVIVYQEELVVNREKKVMINDFEFYFKTPSLRSHIDSGEIWLQEIELTLDEIIGSDSDINRQELYEQLTVADNINKYAHIFHKVIDDEGNIIEEEYMRDFLKLIPNDKEFEQQVLKEMFRFINTNFIAIPGIPVYVCPSCRKAPEGVDDEIKPSGFNEIIPLNVFSIFFDITALKIAGMTSMEEIMS